MKINQINFSPLKYTNKKQVDNKLQNNQLKCDCFEKSSNVSFHGSFFDELLQDSFIDSFLETINLFSKTVKKYHQELRVQAAIIVFSDTSQKGKFSRIKQAKIEDIFKKVENFQPAIPLFTNNGIITVFQMEQFVKNYNRANKACDEISGQPIEAVEIY